MKGEKLIIVRQGGKPYPRNELILEVLREQHDVFEIVSEPGAPFKTLVCLARLWKRRHHARKMLFLFPAQVFVPFMVVCRYLLGKRLYVDAFISMYDSAVNDRQTVRAGSWRARALWLVDALSGRLAHVLWFDTESGGEFFCRTFRLDRQRRVVPVCVDLHEIDAIPPVPAERGKFEVFFYGTYIPLHGIASILEAASRLSERKDIGFTLVGNGQTKREMLALAETRGLSNVRFLEPVPYDRLIGMIKTADLCLGIFGTSEKTGRIVPNKVIDYLACGKATVTGRNVELERFFVDGRDILYCERGDGAGLAAKISEAYAHPERGLGVNGRKRVEESFSRTSLEEHLRAALDERP